MHLKYFQAFDNPDCCPISSGYTVDLRVSFADARKTAALLCLAPLCPLDSHFFSPRCIARQFGCESGMMNLSKT